MALGLQGEGCAALGPKQRARKNWGCSQGWHRCPLHWLQRAGELQGQTQGPGAPLAPGVPLLVRRLEGTPVKAGLRPPQAPLGRGNWSQLHPLQLPHPMCRELALLPHGPRLLRPHPPGQLWCWSQFCWGQSHRLQPPLPFHLPPLQAGWCLVQPPLLAPQQGPQAAPPHPEHRPPWGIALPAPVSETCPAAQWCRQQRVGLVSGSPGLYPHPAAGQGAPAMPPVG